MYCTPVSVFLSKPIRESLMFVSNPPQLSFALQAYYYLLYRHSDVEITNEDNILQAKETHWVTWKCRLNPESSTEMFLQMEFHPNVLDAATWVPCVWNENRRWIVCLSNWCCVRDQVDWYIECILRKLSRYFKKVKPLQCVYGCLWITGGSYNVLHKPPRFTEMPSFY